MQALGLSVCALVAPWTPESAVAAEPGLELETGSPDALCPDLESTRAAVRRRLGELVVPGGGGFVARYTIGHAPAGSPRDFVRLELRSSEGALLLARDLPLDGEPCSTMSEVIALVLDRYFRALLGGDTPPPAAEPASDAAPAPVAAAAPASSSLSPVLAEPAAPSVTESVPEDVPTRPLLPAPALDTDRERLQELALDLAFRGLQRPTVGVRATFELSSWLYAGTAVHLGLYQERDTLLDGAQVKSREAVWRAYVAWGWASGAVRTYLGPGFRASMERASGSGLDGSHTGLRASWGIGADAGVIWSLRDSWALHVSGAVDFHPPGMGGRFYVENGEVLKPSALRGWLGVGLGYDL